MASCVQTVMITCPERANERSVTLAQLAAIGIVPRLAEPTPMERERSHQQHARQGYRGLRDVDPDRGVLLIEDDINLSPRLAWWLRQLADGAATVWLYVPGRSAWPTRWRPTIEQQLPVAPTLIAPRGRAMLWGSQAIWISPRVVAELQARAADPARWVTGGFDIQVREAAAAVGVPLRIAVPNPVQHRPAASLVRSPRHHSLCSDLPAGER